MAHVIVLRHSVSMSLMQIVLVAMRSLKHRKLTALLPSYLSIQTKFSMISGYQFRSITYVLHNSLKKLHLIILHRLAMNQKNMTKIVTLSD